jgi:hypothetical protein
MSATGAIQNLQWKFSWMTDYTGTATVTYVAIDLDIDSITITPTVEKKVAMVQGAGASRVRAKQFAAGTYTDITFKLLKVPATVWGQAFSGKDTTGLTGSASMVPGVGDSGKAPGALEGWAKFVAVDHTNATYATMVLYGMLTLPSGLNTGNDVMMPEFMFEMYQNTANTANSGTFAAMIT